jgi:sugar O-acyltransferase (sialic acid O-acetyltransferase NeuD family)
MKIQKINRDNANDSEVTVSEIINNGEKVTVDVTSVIEVETTKAIIEQYSDCSGYFYSDVSVGDIVEIGYNYAVISDVEIEEKKWLKFLKKSRKGTEVKIESSNQVITKPALKLIDENKISLESFSGIEIVTRQHCLDIIQGSSLKNNERKELTSKLERIVVIGAGTGGTIVYDILSRDSSKNVVYFYDDNLKGESIFGIPILDKINSKTIIESYNRNEFDSVIVTLGSNVDFKDKIYQELKSANLKFTNAIHPSAIVAYGVNLGQGNVVAANVVIGAFTSLGENNIFSSSCVIEHHNTVGISNSFGPNVVTSGTVKIGNKILFATGIFIEPYLTIGNNSIISSGSIITSDVKDNVIVKNIVNSKIVKKK